jgi:ubiquinone/menaquinone biosynthesis C-methylase UbiE
METLESALSALRPRRVLDLATGSGDFALRLASSLGSYGDILAVDSQDKAVEAAAKNLGSARDARAEKADASALPYPAGSFDLVSVSNSLHHFPEPGQVLGEAARVLAPGGTLVVFEMHREAPDEASMSHVLLHHWWAAIDGLCGTFHAETYGREGLRALVAAAKLRDVAELELPGEEGDPFDPEMAAYIGEVIDRYIGKIPAGSKDAAALAARGEELRARVKAVGFRSAPSLAFIGTKR